VSFMAWGIWAIIALVLLILETLTVDFLFMMLSVGALAAAGVAIFSESLVVQITVFSVVSLLALFFVRPWVRNKINSSKVLSSNIDAIVGKQGVTLLEVTQNSGRVKVQGEVWSAKSVQGAIPADLEIIVTKVSGAHLVVEPINVGNTEH
ncbi:MAG: NfeD family protein, partial [Arcanobacterium sp.]|nr:NfeD family protein [Arcanobacterium sp.]